jgi:hypothetical protein
MLVFRQPCAAPCECCSRAIFETDMWKSWRINDLCDSGQRLAYNKLTSAMLYSALWQYDDCDFVRAFF